MPYYRDLREYLGVLESHGRLARINLPVNKDTDIHPVARLQYRGLNEEQRRAFLFEHVSDSHGRRYDASYAVCALAGSQAIYALGLQCEPEEIAEKWAEALRRGIEPRMVGSGPVHDEVHLGERLLEHGGLDEFPIAISTPGFDCAPYITAPCWVTKDLDTGTRNVGMYRAQVKARDRTGVVPSTPQQGIARHLAIARRKGVPLQAVLVLGTLPNIAYVAASAVPHGVDEYAVAGGLAGAPVELVRCKTVDLEVPATAEIVLEGFIPTDEVEPEGPFGEALGVMGLREYMPYFQITCITHRRTPIVQGILGEFPPSEITKLLSISAGSMIRGFLRDECGISSVLDVSQHEQSCSMLYTVIQVQRRDPSEAHRVLVALTSPGGRHVTQFGKVFVVVDEDINPSDADAVNWAISTRSQPHRDIRIVSCDAPNSADPSIRPPRSACEPHSAAPSAQKSILIIDATMKWAYPPLSLPTREHMERARDLWNMAGLPKLRLRDPWCGRSLGHWEQEDETSARLAVRGDSHLSGERLVRRRQKLIPLDP